MELNKIALPTAYMIETLRSHGVSNEEILHQIEKKDVGPWKNMNPDFDFTKLIQFAKQDQNIFQSVVLDGYKIKFVTIYGLKNLLRLKFDKIAEHDYQVTDTGITGLQLEESKLEILKQMLSNNCIVQETSSKSSYKEVQITLT